MSSAPAAAILAGGRARRFGGGAKGLETLGGERIVDRVLTAVRSVADEIVLVGAAPSVAAAIPGVKVIHDEAPGSGPLGGILSALRATGRDTLVVAWDMPFLEAKHLVPLLDPAIDADVVAWSAEGRIQPLCALYRSSANATLRASFKAGERSPQAALRRLRVHLVEREERGEPSPFTSVNTAEQLDAARRAVIIDENPESTA